MNSDRPDTDEFAQFRQTFFEECAELLSALEEHLADLQERAGDTEELNAIFRAVHSIKAGAGAFNFTRLVSFSHTYETLLDALRDGQVHQSEAVTAALVRAADVLATLVEAAQEGRELAADFGEAEGAELAALLQQAGLARHTDTPAPDAVSAVTDDTSAKSASTRYSIRFAPFPELFRHANEPLLLIRELMRLGDVAVTCDTSRLPNLGALEPEDAYLAWDIEIETDRPLADLREVFEFVDEDCDLVIAPEAHLPVAEPIDDEESGTATMPAEATQTVPHPHLATTSQLPASTAETGGAGQAAVNQKSAGVTSIRVDLARVDRLVNVVGELIIAQSMLVQQSHSDAGDTPQLTTTQGFDEIATLTRELQECVMAIRMQPVKSVFARMPRMVRDISAKLGKKVRLVTAGEQTEVDKTVIEELADPLTHMIRNAVDHGIEPPEVRLADGKPEQGTVRLTASHAGGNIRIELTDDGAGISREKLFAKAVEKGLIAPDAKISDEEIDDLIFAPGFSTAAAVSDVSGRGVGMDVVRRNIVNLGGRIAMRSEAGKGTRFTLSIPLTLAVLDGMLVAVGREKYILPLTSIVESFKPDPAHVRALTGGGEVVFIRGEYIRLIHLSRIFGVSEAIPNAWDGLVVLVESTNNNKIGIVVDELIGQQQVVIKSLHDNFEPIPGISGATILGDGRVSLILDVEQLRRMPDHVSGRRERASAPCSDTGSAPIPSPEAEAPLAALA
ncbi:two-component system chemotaxis sensor kinase CheA [Breoghania corrubedonensis]|uniref:Chemotaxis protein CheA n=1 Tax=Breoghania corrubedonensis TaxID=665038 RepID=A0A2T5UU75_9HYPH|nr:chemotaxis protein CheA [Breoghania corrubedonensis]PTW55054.1 two-component system chemotaxis sensor kinase CheA [Breoghania corrubedonensis]